jgi:hypothetical protein
MKRRGSSLGAARVRYNSTRRSSRRTCGGRKIEEENLFSKLFSKAMSGDSQPHLFDEDAAPMEPTGCKRAEERSVAQARRIREALAAMAEADNER